jgi:hypothetical protein
MFTVAIGRVPSNRMAAATGGVTASRALGERVAWVLLQGPIFRQVAIAPLAPRPVRRD